MKVKILESGDEQLLLEFLQSLSPEVLNNWSHYGKIFDATGITQILLDSNEIKIAGLEKNGDEKIIVLGHLYNLIQTTCRLGIVSLRRGYGTKMMMVLIDHCKSIGINKIYLSVFQDNIPAITLYKKFNFKIVQEFTDRPRHAYEMELIL
jgi:ribosomal protein S18 acetylase RimI-like enzyme